MFFQNRLMSQSFDIIIMILILIVCIHQMYEKSIYKSIQETWYLIILWLMFLITCTVLYKIRLFFEELFYMNSNYAGEFLLVAKATLNFNIQSWIIISVTTVSFLMLIINLNYNILQLIQLNPPATLSALAFSILLLYSGNITECRVTKALSVFASGGLDPGTAMACSYFYGYLKIILPASGGKERAGIRTAIEKFEADNQYRLNIPVKKLFILIPSSSYISSDLREISDNWLEHAGSLDTIVIDRAGVKNRTYHNTMYKIRPKGPKIPVKSIYLATEGATPLKTFLEIQDKSHRYSSVYREFNREVINSFYNTLQNLINDNPDCRDCELVYYEDTVNGKAVNPAHVLLERISQIEK